METAKRTVIAGAEIFDGDEALGVGAVVLEGDVIAQVLPGSSGSDGDDRVEARGMTLLPGLIDSHTHVAGPDSLREALRFGVTTELDMFSFPPALTARLRQESPQASERADFRSSGLMAGAKGGWPAIMLPPDPTGWQMPGLSGPQDAAGFVAARKAEGSDYLKVFVDKGRPDGPPTLSAETVAAVCEAARDQGIMTVAHASTLWATRIALAAGVDILTHVPLDGALDADDVKAVLAGGVRVIPTLTMMQALTDQESTGRLVADSRLADRLAPEVAEALIRGERGNLPVTQAAGASYDNAAANVRALYEAGVPILAGTDANNRPGLAGAVLHGASQHLELELLVEAGVSALYVLRAATSLPARTFSLSDRGRIGQGLRADLILVAGDPLEDITATRDIQQAWRAGVAQY